jgi:5-methyltetrahydrofolate--homocysteine methyltransferase
MNMKRLFFDGGMGTSLHERSLSGDPIRFNLSHGETITDIHRKYAEAGANVITANTFGAYTHKHPDAAELIGAAIRHAQKANPGRIALDISPTGNMLEPYGDMTFEEAHTLFLEAVQAGAEFGADMVLIETFYCINELKAAVCAAKTTSLPVFATMTFDKRGRTSMGVSIRDMVGLLEGLGVAALGMNCGFGPDIYRDLLPELLNSTQLPVLVQPNAGLPEMVGDQLTYNVNPTEFARIMAQMADGGCTHLGGCCGTTPAHIAAMVLACGTRNG